MINQSNNQNAFKEYSMLEIALDILQKNPKPMPVYQLIEQVLDIKKIENLRQDCFLQLYLDIVISGLFVFHGEDLWGIKTDNLDLWDKEYYADEEKSDIDNELLDLKYSNNLDDDFRLENDSDFSHTDETADREILEDIDDVVLGDDEAVLREESDSVNAEEDKNEDINEYDWAPNEVTRVHLNLIMIFLCELTRRLILIILFLLLLVPGKVKCVFLILMQIVSLILRTLLIICAIF
ncbi:DNA-directed RNA polymerase subunit delta [Candidatus Phytoplasma australasiaticum]